MRKPPRKQQEKAERDVRLGGEQQNYPGPRPPEWRGELGAGGPEKPSAPEEVLEEEQAPAKKPAGDVQTGGAEGR